MSGYLSLERVSTFLSQNPHCQIQNKNFSTLLQQHTKQTSAPFSGCVAMSSRRDDGLHFFDSTSLISYLMRNNCFAYPKDTQAFTAIHFFSTRDVTLVNIESLGVAKDTITADLEVAVIACSAVKEQDVRQARRKIYAKLILESEELHNARKETDPLIAKAFSWIQCIVKDFPDDIDAQRFLGKHLALGMGCKKDRDAAKEIFAQALKTQVKKVAKTALKLSFVTTCCFILPEPTVKFVLLSLYAMKVIPYTQNLCRGNLARYFKVSAVTTIFLNALAKAMITTYTRASPPSFSEWLFSLAQPEFLYLGLGPLADGINKLKARLSSPTLHNRIA
jgi:hypothetical protein